MVTHEPIGVVATITPFNFPIAIPAWKIAPALIYGNTVVWKPASSVPLLAMRLAQALIDAGLPPGVLNLLIADRSVGTALAGHAGVDAVTFTGSTGWDVESPRMPPGAVFRCRPKWAARTQRSCSPMLTWNSRWNK